MARAENGDARDRLRPTSANLWTDRHGRTALDIRVDTRRLAPNGALPPDLLAEVEDAVRVALGLGVSAGA